MHNSPDLDQLVVATLKALVMDGTRRANSGHPGGAMSSTDFAYILFREYLRFDPSDPEWPNRDRFVLSAGHESMLLYSLLAMAGYLEIQDLKDFRQYNSRTPGHPESHLTPGVDATTGPLGQGVGMAVGMALAESLLQAKLGEDLFEHFTYVLAGDGDLQEPVAFGAAALAGHLGLGKVIMFYDRNEVQISGHISRSDSTNVGQVFEGFGWQVLEIDGHDHPQIRAAIEQAQGDSARPTIIIGRTIMAKGTATREGDHHTHGSPLPAEEIQATKEKLGLPGDATFQLPQDAIDHFRSRFESLERGADRWRSDLHAKRGADEKFAALWERIFRPNSERSLEMPAFEDGASVSTRVAFGQVLTALADQLPTLAGGSADLEPSNQTRGFMERAGEFSRSNRQGRNLAFGVREFPMGTILNGMALHGGIQGFGATFLVFADYERPALRLSALQNLPVLHVFTHDSFYVGEDGPTHQPIEHLASLRAIPNLLVFRPADARETAFAMQVALGQDHRPAALALTRQNLPVLDQARSSLEKVSRGGYILSGDPEQTPDLILLASGSEVHLALEVAERLSPRKVRVVSMPSMELFDEQPEEYRREVLPDQVTQRFAIEAAATFGWDRYTGLDGAVYGIDRYGASAPAKDLEVAFGFTPENLVEWILQHLRR